MSLTPVAAGHLAAIVTSLEMTARPRPAPMPGSPLSLVPWKAPTPDRYRALYRRIGEHWLWFSRLMLDDAALLAIIADPQVAVFAVTDRSGIEIGMLELDFRESGQCEIAFFGLVSDLAGQGHGRWLMAQALALGWRKDVTRMWVHTCTLDHPGALGFYRRQGFVPYQRQVEIFADPRLIGILPADAAPQVPLLTRT